MARWRMVVVGFKKEDESFGGPCRMYRHPWNVVLTREHPRLSFRSTPPFAAL
jgi:hypothetical protein